MIMGSAAVIAANNQRKAEEQSRKIHKAKKKRPKVQKNKYKKNCKKRR